MTVSVARIMGFPTSSTASTASDTKAPVRPVCPRVSDDVLDDNDRIVHEDADREDEREQRDAIERIAVEVDDEQPSARA